MKTKATRIHVAFLNRLRIIQEMLGFSDGVPSALITIVGEQLLGTRNVQKALIFIKGQGWLTHNETRAVYKVSPSAPTCSRIGEEPTDLPATELKLLVANFQARHR